jgi:electron-transferring-flavoprotein dehydrogenase
MLAAEVAFAALQAGRSGDELTELQTAYEKSWVYKELKGVRKRKAAVHALRSHLGLVASGIDMWITHLTGGFSPWGTLKHGKTDAASTGLAADHKPIEYPKYDGVISFDKLSSVYMSNTNHEEDQPCAPAPEGPLNPDQSQPSQVWRACATLLPRLGLRGRLRRAAANPKFVINAQNCVHCKTCDIKDPSQNIVWTTPEGGGGPNYPNM